MLCRLRDGALFAVPLRYHVSVTAPLDAELIARGEPGEILVISESGDFAFLSKQEFDRMFEAITTASDDEKDDAGAGTDLPPAVRNAVLQEINRVTVANLAGKPGYRKAKEAAVAEPPAEILSPLTGPADPNLGVPYPPAKAAEPQVSLLQRIRETLALLKAGATLEELKGSGLNPKGNQISMSLSYLKKHGDAFFEAETGRWKLTNQGRLAERKRRLELTGDKEGAAA